MEKGRRSFEDYVYDGMDSFLKLTAKAGDSIRVASNRAIEKIDLSQLERRLTRLYGELGEIAYRRLAEGLTVDLHDLAVARLVDDIEKTSAEIASRHNGTPEREESDGNGKKNENGY